MKINDTPLPKAAGVYCIKNTINSNLYIGSAVNICTRKWRHLNELKKGIHTNQKLQRFCNKYGIDVLAFEVIELCDINNLIDKEQHYLDILNPKFNILKRAYSNLGFKHRKNSKARIKGKILSVETRKKISERRKGISFDDEHKKKLSDAKKGRQLSEGHKKLLSEKQKNWLASIHTEESKQIKKGLIIDQFLTGVVSINKACKAARVSKNSYYLWLKTDPVFNEAINSTLKNAS